MGDTKMVREFCELLLQSRPCYNLEWTRNSEEKFKFENFRVPSFPRLVIRFLAAYLAALTLLTRLSRPRSCNRIKNPPSSKGGNFFTCLEQRKRGVNNVFLLPVFLPVFPYTYPVKMVNYNRFIFQL